MSRLRKPGITAGFMWAALLTAGIVIGVLAFQNRDLRADLAQLRERELGTHIGQVLPTFIARPVNDSGQVVVGSSPEGTRQILFVFNTTCPWCRRTLPAWSALSREFRHSGEAGVRVYGISLDPEPETRAYITEHDISFPVVRFPEEKLTRIYRIAGIPTTIVLDHNGVVLHTRRGSLENEAAIDSIRMAAGQGAARTFGTVSIRDARSW